MTTHTLGSEDELRRRLLDERQRALRDRADLRQHSYPCEEDDCVHLCAQGRCACAGCQAHADPEIEERITALLREYRRGR